MPQNLYTIEERFVMMNWKQQKFSVIITEYIDLRSNEAFQKMFK